MKKYFLALGISVLCSSFVIAQTAGNDAPIKPVSEDAKLKSDAEQEKKAAEWTKSLNLSDANKEARVQSAIATHLKTIRDWNNEHPASTVPAGINPSTGNRLSELDRQVIANSAMPKSVHDSLLNVLNRELTSEQ